MEKVVRKICLDTDVLIQIMRDDPTLKETLSSMDASFHTTTISVFEIWQGHKQSEGTLELIHSLIKLDFDEKSAFAAGDIQRKLSDAGEILDFRDLFIASICIKNDAELFTFNKKHFERLKKFGLKLAELQKP
jgi:tRNA(fMet)-specific endonuclease VapC